MTTLSQPYPDPVGVESALRTLLEAQVALRAVGFIPSVAMLSGVNSDDAVEALVARTQYALWEARQYALPVSLGDKIQVRLARGTGEEVLVKVTSAYIHTDRSRYQLRNGRGRDGFGDILRVDLARIHRDLRAPREK